MFFFVLRRRGPKSAPNAQFGSEIADEKSVHRKADFGRFSFVRSCSLAFVRVCSCSFLVVFGRRGRPQHVQTRTGGPNTYKSIFGGSSFAAAGPSTRKRENANANDQTTIYLSGAFFRPRGRQTAKGGDRRGLKVASGVAKVVLYGAGILAVSPPGHAYFYAYPCII